MVVSKSLLSALALASIAAAETVNVNVGQGGLKFVPDNIKAKAGDQVVFHFVDGHHDVTLGRYDSPCMPAEGQGIFSGVVDTVEKGKGVTFTNGMSLVINEPHSGDNQNDYKDRAKVVAKSGTPTQVQGGILSGDGGSSSSSSAPTQTTTSSSGSSSGSSSSTDSSTSTTDGGPDATLIPSGSIPSGTQSGSTSATGTAGQTGSPTASPGSAAGLKGSATLAGLVALGAWAGLL
ncbi:hypothetical protein McanCB56680_005171 [Microsporum canis]